MTLTPLNEMGSPAIPLSASAGFAGGFACPIQSRDYHSSLAFAGPAYPVIQLALPSR